MFTNMHTFHTIIALSHMKYYPFGASVPTTTNSVGISPNIIDRMKIQDQINSSTSHSYRLKEETHRVNDHGGASRQASHDAHLHHLNATDDATPPRDYQKVTSYYEKKCELSLKETSTVSCTSYARRDNDDDM